MKKLSWRGAALLVAGFGVTSLVIQALPWSLAVNFTPSVPKGLYLLYQSHPADTYDVGTLVSFSYTAPEWTSVRKDYPKTGANFMKYIGGVPGEYLFTERGSVFACRSKHLDVALCRGLGLLRAADSKGRPLPQNIWRGEEIPPGYLFMTATRVAASYDSRQYGLVHQAAIRGRLAPLLTW